MKRALVEYNSNQRIIESLFECVLNLCFVEIKGGQGKNRRSNAAQWWSVNCVKNFEGILCTMSSEPRLARQVCMMSALLPKRTLAGATGLSALCQKQTCGHKELIWQVALTGSYLPSSRRGSRRAAIALRKAIQATIGNASQRR
jgi:hypothetical protein